MRIRFRSRITHITRNNKGKKYVTLYIHIPASIAKAYDLRPGMEVEVEIVVPDK